jgi:hypothetical protein
MSLICRRPDIYLTRIVVTDQFDDAGPKGDIQNGWSWYVGI